jgi:endoglucanase
VTLRFLRRGSAALAGAALLAAAPFATAPASAVTSNPLPGKTHFYVPPASDGAQKQIKRLRADVRDRAAALVNAEVKTPQAVWFTDGTPKQVRKAVSKVSSQADKKNDVPTLVVYNVPGRDCSQYSSGGAGSDKAYRAWVDGFAKGLKKKQKVIVVVEPDGLTNLPSDCPSAYPGQDVGTFPNPAPGTLTAGRIADIAYAGKTIRKANSKALVYLDSGHSAWKSVADASARLTAAGVQKVQGFSLNVSNYQWTPNLSEYGTWISSCLALHPDAATKTPTDCGDQYYSGGPANQNVGVALEPKAHFVVDTSRNGRGPWVPAAGKYANDAQVWCNPPERGLGERPKAHPTKDYPQLDAYLWIKTPGQSDGQCNRGVTGSTTDPEWGGITDPAAGAWFPKQALQLARLAEPKLQPKR